MKLPFHYRANKKIKSLAMWIMNLAAPRSTDARIDLHERPIRKILLVRANTRLGDTILAIPAILLFRTNFPNARIDFVGSTIGKMLFRNLPVARYYQIRRPFPGAWWDYRRLMKEIRSVGYDLTVDVSGSQSAMGAFIVGFSGAALRAGLRGKRDRWYNIRVPRPAEINKYRTVPMFVAALGLPSDGVFPTLALSAADKAEGARRIEALVGRGDGPVVGVFVGGRIGIGKRWPARYFLQLVAGLKAQGRRVALFVGPEEKDLIGFFEQRLGRDIPVIHEPSPWIFATMVSQCDLFVTCDGGPMHLACAAGARTVAIFLQHNYDRWGPSPSLGRIVYQPGGPSAENVLEVCLQELSNASGGLGPREPLAAGPRSEESRPSTAGQPTQDPAHVSSQGGLSPISGPPLPGGRAFSFSGYAHIPFYLAMVAYAWFFPPSGLFTAGTWLEGFTDSVGIGSVLAGGFLRIWAAAHAGRHDLSRDFKAPMLVTTGPYAYVRQPIYTGNLLIALGMIFLAEAFILTPLLLALFAWQHTNVAAAEEEFLKEKFGEDFDLYRLSVPKYVPKVLPRKFSLGIRFPLMELGAVWGIFLVGFFLEWIESPRHRRLLVHFYHWLLR